MRRRYATSVPLASVLLATALGLAACGSGGQAPTSGGSPAPGSVANSAQVEVNPPGDIPDNQVFITYRAPTFMVSVPEGWSRTAQGTAVVFTDKYNSIAVDMVAVASPPTTASAQSGELPQIRAHATGFVAGSVTAVRRSSGAAVLITYRAQSAVNPVTGKVANLAVERYEFWRTGRQVVLTLAAPVGSDNVDPWRKVTDSFAWTGK